MTNPADSTLQPLRPSQSLLQLWSARCLAGTVLERAGIDPVIDLPRTVAYMLLLQRQQAGFRYRVVGSQVVQMTGRDVTGRYVEAGLYPNAADRLNAILDRCCRSGQAFVDRCAVDRSRSGLYAEFAGIPMRASGVAAAGFVLGTFQIHGRSGGTRPECWDGTSELESLWFQPDSAAAWAAARTAA